MRCFCRKAIIHYILVNSKQKYRLLVLEGPSLYVCMFQSKLKKYDSKVLLTISKIFFHNDLWPRPAVQVLQFKKMSRADAICIESARTMDVSL